MIKTAAILGGGVIGGGWTARFLLMGWNVQVFDPDPDIESNICAVLDKARRSLPGLSDIALPAEGQLSFTNSLAQAVKNAEWIQESVPEQLSLKQKILADVQLTCRNDAVIASSTSGFKPSQLRENSCNPAQIIVAHPLDPVYLLPLVELVGEDVTVAQAKPLLAGLGMHPLHIKKEVETRISDRLQEAIWHESLCLVKDGIASTEDIDKVIRYGFGLHLAHMGVFETSRITGDNASPTHFPAQIDPARVQPRGKPRKGRKRDAPLISVKTKKSDAQTRQMSPQNLEQNRDDTLVTLLRALKARDVAAGATLNAHDNTLRPSAPNLLEPFQTLHRSVPIDWTDYNGHMNESRYGQVFSDAADEVMRLVGADEDYIAAGLSFFTAEITIGFRQEALAGDMFRVTTTVLMFEGKKLRLQHDMHHRDGRLLATGTQFVLHVDLKTRRSCPPRPDIALRLTKIAAAHATSPQRQPL